VPLRRPQPPEFAPRQQVRELSPPCRLPLASTPPRRDPASASGPSRSVSPVATAIATSQGADQLGNLTAPRDGYQAAFLGAAVIAAAGALLAAVLLRVPKAAAVAAEPVEEQERVAA
jgi:hypothetical protein